MMSNSLNFMLCDFKSVSVKRTPNNFVVSIEFLDGRVRSFVMSSDVDLDFKLKGLENVQEIMKKE